MAFWMGRCWTGCSRCSANGAHAGVKTEWKRWKMLLRNQVGPSELAYLYFPAGFEKSFNVAEIGLEGKPSYYQLPEVQRNTTACPVQSIAQPLNHQTIWCTGSDIFCIHVYWKLWCIRKAIYSLQFCSCVMQADSHSCPPLSMLFFHSVKDSSVDRNLLIDYYLVPLICFWASILPTEPFKHFSDSVLGFQLLLNTVLFPPFFQGSGKTS